MLENAISIAWEYHQDQLDKSGAPYFNHLLGVMNLVSNEHDSSGSIKSTAILHDVLEDTECTVEDLVMADISTTVIKAVIMLTRKEDEPYSDYIDRLSDTSDESTYAAIIAKKVKIADLKHNLSHERQFDGWESLKPRYEKSLEILGA